MGGEECLREGGLCSIDMERCEAKGVTLVGILEKNDGITITPVKRYISKYEVIVTYEKISEYNH